MLYQHFVHYEYRLHNSFVYAWESDFFAISGSSYCVEVEVKISRGDYFRDFQKDKHLLFNALHNKKQFYITSRGCQGDRLAQVRIGSLKGVADFENRRHDIWQVKHKGKYGYWVNDNDNAYIQWHWKDLYAPATHVQFHKVENRKCPNQLYFACPKDLIKLEEIPPYAGLIYCDADITVVRRAPYLHKIKQNMNIELLQKFYHLWQYKTTLDKKFEVTKQYNLFTR